jgi:hypothetical protein
MRKLTALIVFLFEMAGAGAQQSYVDTTGAGFPQKVYLTQMSKELSLYNGIQYTYYNLHIEGIPFLLSDDWQTGSVVYDGVLYENIRMKYELVIDKLVITPDPQGGMAIRLFSPRVKEFSFQGKKFIMIDTIASLEEGFYQELVKGKVSALARKQKFIDEKLETTGIIRKFIERNRYYIIKNDKPHTIRNKNDLLNVLKEKKNEIQQALKDKNLNYRSNPEESLVVAVEIYNQANQF